MTALVDTSALLAILNVRDPHHRGVADAWARLVRERARLRTHSYVVVESTSLVQRRHGMDAVRILHSNLVPRLSIRFVDQRLHDRAVTALLAADRRQVSLVDWTSFELMREERITEALALDDDFSTAGFTVIP